MLFFATEVFPPVQAMLADVFEGLWSVDLDENLSSFVHEYFRICQVLGHELVR